MIQPSYPMASLLMRAELVVIAMRQRNNPPNGRTKVDKDWKGHNKWRAKCMLLIFLDTKTTQSIPHSTVKFYKGTLKKCKTGSLNSGNKGTGCCPNDNVPCHTSLFTRIFLMKDKIIIVFHPLYSPNLVPCDFALSLKMKIQVERPSVRQDWHVVRRIKCIPPKYTA